MTDAPRALSRCGRWTTTIVRVLAAPLFGVLIQWHCPHCGERWMTR